MSVTTLSEVEAAVAAVAGGKFVVVLDDVDRENEADLILAADNVTPEASPSWCATPAGWSASG